MPVTIEKVIEETRLQADSGVTIGRLMDDNGISNSDGSIISTLLLAPFERGNVFAE